MTIHVHKNVTLKYWVLVFNFSNVKSFYMQTCKHVVAEDDVGSRVPFIQQVNGAVQTTCRRQNGSYIAVNMTVYIICPL